MFTFDIKCMISIVHLSFNIFICKIYLCIYGSSNYLLFRRIVNYNFNLILNAFFKISNVFRALNKNLDSTLFPGSESDHIRSIMIDSVEICYVEITFWQETHIFQSLQGLWIICKEALVIYRLSFRERFDYCLKVVWGKAIWFQCIWFFFFWWKIKNIIFIA